ncbi:biotin--[acetyl-CoA-carboxylase] ligase [Microbacterium saccharophilum]|uniref:biotin--[biotin carboxyl-carrier protein] ligase n=1 Tax=Microbacterium saccharophilum TaxID=1213358 RepID=A0A5C8IAC8_9MICO|nr:biotin--[acetyl-CoA-carboxylase] ligase [Microbacterium saccharophilum]TXK15630.1 biotin--[acetyl-CoA-carboxylase] ligase [Microbacterium saccharophilum]GEP47934.1 biotin--[acetyl-CoA-carboxylase] ligase [Microbacterium saccharophilum]
MALSPHGYPLAAAVSPRVHVVETVDSTNAKLLADAAADPDGHPHLSLVVTRDQRAGRGRLDRTWTTPPGTALAVSVLLRVGAVPAAMRGWIPLVAGAAMTKAVAAQLNGHDVALKWPNDVLVDGRKICGILAEVLPSDPFAVVVGAGVNTAMPDADLPITTATSFLALGREADEDRLLADYLTGLRDRIAALAVTGAGAVHDDIQALCATVGADVRVSLPDGTTLTGTATGLDAEGRLLVRTEAGETAVAAGDVVHVR